MSHKKSDYVLAQRLVDFNPLQFAAVSMYTQMTSASPFIISKQNRRRPSHSMIFCILGSPVFILKNDVFLIFIIISMSGWERNLKKDFSLGQYYTQLQKYQVKSGANKNKPLKKDISLSSFAKDTSKPFHTQQTYKETQTLQRPKLDLNDKYTQKLSFQNYDSSKLEVQKKSKVNDDRKKNIVIADSLANSGVSSKQWLGESEEKEKTDILFSTKDEKTFVDHCKQLYQMPYPPSVEQLSNEIQKRDQVYQLVGQQFEGLPQEKYKKRLRAYFYEYELMKNIIAQFKSMSKLEIDDLSELYYFLKTDS